MIIKLADGWQVFALRGIPSLIPMLLLEAWEGQDRLEFGFSTCVFVVHKNLIRILVKLKSWKWKIVCVVEVRIFFLPVRRLQSPTLKVDFNWKGESS